MIQGGLYELEFPYQERQGFKKRPVLIIVVRTDYGAALGLKVTKSKPTERHPHRIEIKRSPKANLPHTSYVQIDRYDYFEDVDIKPKGQLSNYDFRRIIQAFKNYYHV
ncbi:hypothetical protein GCM10007063_12510 [Lentibacillus kapialis]|uniref:Type II toxin-antitoxin system PemK/MazF family toxin n=1 Tax=Lentibacillus kapialis TaxID=340214 RepID=A0A917PTF1_9BACI|nr:type II toxin-antitoxin system PemK/MazF family toxin [Lentibacillus kapialis]GGJ91366.1 hypothetical protein GCM10007063_12510 [Lentibacillus kapialis]